jgi:hypothetical protein
MRISMFENFVTPKYKNINVLTPSELKYLIAQLESCMVDILFNKELERAKVLNELIGKCIDRYTEISK